MPIFHSLFVILAFCLCISSCLSPQKLVEQQKYDQAIQQLVKKFKTSKKRPTDLVLLLEQAYFEIMGADLTSIADLKDKHQAENWDDIAAIYDRIDQRQQLIAPLLPIIDENQKEAHLALIDVTLKKEEAQKEATKFHYYEGIFLLDSANNTNNRFLARQAYEHFIQAQKYLADYSNQDLQEYISAAKDLGSTYVLVQWETNSSIHLPNDFYSIAISNLGNANWIVFYTVASEEFAPNYILTLKTTYHKVSNDEYDVYSSRSSREVTDGEEIVYDTNGNAMKDKNGKTVTRPKIITVSCSIKEMRQYKYVKLITTFELKDNMQDRILHEEDWQITQEFDNRYITYTGDRRALSDEHQDMLGNSREVYPDSDELTLLAAEQLRYLVKDVWDDEVDEIE